MGLLTEKQDTSQGCALTTIIVRKRCSICFWMRSIFMACPVVFEVTMAPKTFLLLYIWKKCGVYTEDRTYGEGESSACPNSRRTLCADLILSSRSVHNIRIERLWVDLTANVGAKWKQFFQDLEAYDNLDPGIDTHIWLLHHLFLAEINRDIDEWVGAWNNHVMTIRGERSRSPRDMFFFGMIKDGLRGVELAVADDDEDEDLPEDELVGYGIDWQELDDPHIRAHHEAANDAEDLDDAIAPGAVGQGQRPDNLNEVVVDVPFCTLTAEQVQLLDQQLNLHNIWQSRTLEEYRLRWRTAFNICRHMDVI